MSVIGEKFNNNSITISGLLNDISNGYIAIPEIQRPFVWDKSQVRDLLDSLYNGYPVGYIVIWKNPNTRLKDGTIANGKKVIIDGQQRITALMSSLKGITIVNKNYKHEVIKISFNPKVALGLEEGDLFAVQTASIVKDKKWIPDISVFFKDGVSIFELQKEFCANNPDITPDQFAKIYESLTAIKNLPVGQIELSHDLDLDVVTEIFIRLNSKGTVLSTADFAMSRIAADEKYGGKLMRKAIDYFAHLAVEPTFITDLCNDEEFVNSEFFKFVEWLKDENDDVYDPDYSDVLRVAFMYATARSKLSDLVSMLSGRDFETRDYKEEKAEKAFSLLKKGIKAFMNEWRFKQFLVMLKSAGFVNSKLINANMPLNFAYTLYLLALESHEFNAGEVNQFVQKWYVLSILTQRYSSSPESQMWTDLRNLKEKGFRNYFNEIESSVISDAFWKVKIPQDLENTSGSNPTYLTYLAAQIKNSEISLLSHSTKVVDLVETMGDVHHIFPKAYLKKENFEKKHYNQEANYAYLDTQVNIDIGEKCPSVYFSKALNQCDTKVAEIGTIFDKDELMQNLKTNCIPDKVFGYTAENYFEFLEERRKLMALKIKDYYDNL